MAIARPRRFVRGHHLKHPYGFNVQQLTDLKQGQVAPTINTWYQVRTHNILASDPRERLWIEGPEHLSCDCAINGTSGTGNILLDVGVKDALWSGDPRLMYTRIYAPGTTFNDYTIDNFAGGLADQSFTEFPIIRSYNQNLGISFHMRWRRTDATSTVTQLGTKLTYVNFNRGSKRSLL